jgi:ribosome-associated heat shock protein Hsp15
MEKEKLRIDKYLWSIRIFKTRALSAEACDGGRVKLNGLPVKASKSVQINDQYEIKTSDRKWIIKVTGLLHSRKAYAEAILFYTDLTPEEDKTTHKAAASSFYTGKRLSKVGRPTKAQRKDWETFMEDKNECSE